MSEPLETRTCPGYRADRYRGYTSITDLPVSVWYITRDDGVTIRNPTREIQPHAFSEAEFDSWWPRICRGEVPNA